MSEPETSCWQIAKQVGSLRDVSNTCRDCIVYLLQSETSIISKKEIFEILNHRENSKKMGTGCRVCILKNSLTH